MDVSFLTVDLIVNIEITFKNCTNNELNIGPVALTKVV
jgi:hypothetical protein